MGPEIGGSDLTTGAIDLYKRPIRHPRESGYRTHTSFWPNGLLFKAALKITQVYVSII
jgi:hypothetical protein